ncbi:uncharacterized protein BP01DRAFT_367662 [Aspergillus saccharolyticus JOP 1030-1]|uniref:Uncharacterized protein n=1 Tax=Aspergillus saccharolyticus JOP 1030-1 TaxID=1450539 RepID=A0A318ZEV4_9EURO|nr:hypothetical protein BP01DRAFT_367662 [Aspergillus saccharolyticus JOP 1030-1]PYH43163.1 hypothetical protein BP01DRAFT_367662 [Aspergillus saccharolyticus JOP 1030-1]
MGHNVTEGAIVQHLAKLRSRRVAAGKPVPPPLRRGGLGAGTSSNQAEALHGKKTPYPDAKRQRATPKSKRDGELGLSDFADVDSSSDEDYVVGSASRSRKKRTNTAGSRGRRKQKRSFKLESDSGAIETGDEEDSLLIPGAEFLDGPRQSSSAGNVSESATDLTPNDAFLASGYTLQQQFAGADQFPIQGHASATNLPENFYSSVLPPASGLMHSQPGDTGHNPSTFWFNDTTLGYPPPVYHGLTDPDVQMGYSGDNTSNTQEQFDTLLRYDDDSLG